MMSSEENGVLSLRVFVCWVKECRVCATVTYSWLEILRDLYVCSMLMRAASIQGGRRFSTLISNRHVLQLPEFIAMHASYHASISDS